MSTDVRTADELARDPLLRRAALSRWPILVDEDPSPKGDPRRPITGKVGERMADLMGLQWPHEYLASVGRLNLFATHQGDAWDAERAGRQMEEVLDLVRAAALARGKQHRDFFPTAPLFALGRRVAAAIVRGDGKVKAEVRLDLAETKGVVEDVERVAFFSVGFIESGKVGLPMKFCTPILFAAHPSQRNTWWNDPEHVAHARACLRELTRACHSGRLIVPVNTVRGYPSKN